MSQELRESSTCPTCAKTTETGPKVQLVPGRTDAKCKNRVGDTLPSGASRASLETLTVQGDKESPIFPPLMPELFVNDIIHCGTSHIVLTFGCLRLQACTGVNK